ncbi:MAG: PAS domain S-box protein [Burkholderiales bacterium]
MDLFTSFARQGDGSSTWLWFPTSADAVIAMLCFAVPLAIFGLARRRGGAAGNRVVWLISAFFVALGLLHGASAWNVLSPLHGMLALVRVAALLLAVASFVLVCPMLHQLLAIPRVAQLHEAMTARDLALEQRQGAEDDLSDSQQCLATTLACIGAGMLTIDRAGAVAAMNDLAEHLLGWPIAQARGLDVGKVFVRAGQNHGIGWTNPVDTLMADRAQADRNEDVVVVSRSGVPTPVAVRTSLLFAGDGSARGAVIVFRDVSDARRAEAAATRLAAIVESSVDAIIGKTLDGRITSWNAAAETLFGYTAPEAVGQSVRMLIPVDRENEEMDILRTIAAGARVPPFDTLRRAKNGRLVTVSIGISPIRDAHGAVVGAAKIVRDVSVARRAEAVLRENESRLRFILDSARVGEWTMDLRTGVSLRSKRHDQCFGYVRFDGPWTIDTFTRHVHPEDRAQTLNSLQSAVARSSDWQTECRVVWPDASVHWVRMHGSVRRHAGAPAHMIGIVIDTTTERLAESHQRKAERLEAENRQIQEANRVKTLFLANMSHELRTPLNAIIGFADLLRSGAVPLESDKHQEFLGHIGESGRHLLALINDVLDMSKVESGKFEFYPEPVDLRATIEGVVDILGNDIRRRNLEVVIDADAALREVVIDSTRFKQVLYNYLSNAIKFSRTATRVTVRALVEDAESFRVEVEDHGPGIAHGDLPRLFVEFEQLDSSLTRKHMGTGLGLALTRRIVEGQGGRVGVRSLFGVGSVFHLVLPRAQPARLREATPTAVARPVLAEALPATEPRLDPLACALTEAGWPLDTGARGQTDLLHALGHVYDSISLDLLLPRQAPPGVLSDVRRLRNVHGHRPALPDLSPGFAIADVLRKPIHADQVAAAMRGLRPDGAQPTVLVIDDDPQALDLMGETLRQLGMIAVCMQDGRRALHELDRHAPDAIILDLMMPRFDGFAVLDAVRKLPAWKDTPVFIWTSMILTDEEYAKLARAARAVLSKGQGPLDDLLDNLRRWRPPVPGSRASGALSGRPDR